MRVGCGRWKPAAMTRYLRRSALAAPLLLLSYGLLRLVDGLDGSHGPGVAWYVGHTAFLLSMLLLGVVAVGVRRLLPTSARWLAALGTAAAAAVLAGVAVFAWVILGDLRLDGGLGAPDPVLAVGPPLFTLGMVALLGLAAAVPPRPVPAYSPVFFLGFAAPALSLDLLPLAGLLVLIALVPLARGPEPDRTTRTADATRGFRGVPGRHVAE